MLQRLQNMSLKSILQTNKRTSTVTIHENLDMIPLETRRNIHSTTQMYKVNKELVPATISNMFTPLEAGHRNTRCETRGNYVIQRCRLEFGHQNFRYRGPVLWDSLPTSLKQAKNLQAFKKANEEHWKGTYPNGIM